MKFSDWLWCKWHGICIKHRIPKKFSMGGSYCKECRAEYWDECSARLKQIQESH